MSLSFMRGAAVVFLLTTTLTLPLLHTAQADSGEVVIAVTHPSLKSVVSAVGGDRVKILLLVPYGVDPHHYEPPASELRSLLKDAKIVLMTGPSHLPIEERIEELYRYGSFGWTLVTYRNYVSNGLKLLVNPTTGQINPHGYFLSISGLRATARSLYDALVSVDPESKDYYEYRLRLYLDYLEKLTKALESVASNVKVARVGLLTPILQYACADVGLEVVYILLREHGIPVETRDILEAVGSYGKLYDALLLSDTDFFEYPKVVEELARRGVRVVVVPTSVLAQESPELIPLATALSLTTPSLAVENRGGETAVYFATIVVLLILAGFLVIYTLRLRSYGATKK